MKRVALDRKSKAIKEFVRSLPVGAQGCVLSMGGKALLKVIPVKKKKRLDRGKLRQAILESRDESRRLNAEWEHVDQEIWAQVEENEKR